MVRSCTIPRAPVPTGGDFAFALSEGAPLDDVDVVDDALALHLDGTDKHGTIDFLCDHGIACSIDAAQENTIVGPQDLEVKGLLFADDARSGSASATTPALFEPRDLAVLNPNTCWPTLVRECQPGDQIECGGEMIDCPDDGTCAVLLGGVPCATNDDCATSDMATFCTLDSCVDGCYESVPGKFGDVSGPCGGCGPDGSVALNDIIAVLNGFEAQFRAPCTEGNIDIGGTQGSCVPDGTICAGGGPAVQPPSRRWDGAGSPR